MGRYFKITEIDADTFTAETGDYLDCCQVVANVGGCVYVAIDADEEDSISVDLDRFDMGW